MSSRVREILKSGVVPGEREDALGKVAKQGPGAGLAALQAEMLREMAASLGRASERLSGSLARLAKLDEQIGKLEQKGVAPGALGSAVEAYNDERDRAEKLRWELSVQREALGIRNQRALERHYPLPPRRR